MDGIAADPVQLGPLGEGLQVPLNFLHISLPAQALEGGDMMPQVVAKSLDLLIVLPKIFIVFPDQFPTLEEKPLLGAALGFPPEQVHEGGQDAGGHGQCGPRPQQEAGQAILEAGPEMEHQLTPPCGIGHGADAADCRPQSQGCQEQRCEQAVEAVPPLSPDQGEDGGG